MTKKTEKSDFFAENERFSRLIRYYARRLHDPHAEGDLWGFLWLIEKRSPPNDRYIAVALRNEYIRLSRSEAENKLSTDLSTDLSTVTTLPTFEIAEAFEVLSQNEREAVRYFVAGFSASEVAEIRHTSRQNETDTRRRAFLKMRNFLTNSDR